MGRRVPDDAADTRATTISPDSGATMNKERRVIVRPKVGPNRDASGVRGAPATVAVPLAVTECQSLGGKIEGHSGCGTGFTCITVDKSGDIGFACVTEIK